MTEVKEEINVMKYNIKYKPIISQSISIEIQKIYLKLKIN
jgi:hypothetical protein